MNEEIRALRDALEEALDKLDKRLSHVEVGVRALEDRELARKVLEQERARVASDVAAKGVTKRQFWIGVAGVAVAAASPQIAALIAHLP